MTETLGDGQITPELSADGTSAGRATGGAGRRARKGAGSGSLLHRFLAAVLVAAVLVAPLPVGSNRGAAWMFWVLLLSLCGFAYFVARGARGNPSRDEAPALRHLLWLPAAFVAYALVQIVPFGAALPDWAVALPPSGAKVPATISVAPAASYIGALRFASMTLFLVLMMATTGRLSRARKIGWVLFFGVVLYAIWALLSLRFFGDTFFWGEKIFSKGIATGPFINRNSFATFLGMGAVLGLSLALERLGKPNVARSGLARLIGAEGVLVALTFICIAIILITQLATQSRMGTAATLVALALVWVLSLRPARSRAVFWFAAAAVLAVAIFALATLGEDVVTRSLFAEEDFGVRLALYRQVWEMIVARPFTGYGLDAFPAAFELFHHAPVSAALLWDNAHSTYLTLWVEMGLVVGSIPLIVALAMALRLLRILRNRQHELALPIAALGCLVVIALHSTVDFSLEMQANQFLALSILALGLRRRQRAGLKPA